MRTRLDDLEMDAWQALLHAHHQITTTLDAELRAEHGLSWSDYDVLLRLARAPEGLRMTDLAQRVMMSPSGLTRALDGLVRDGLVERARDSADARAVIATLTTKGRAILKRASLTHLRGIREHYTGKLSRSQLREVAMALGAIAGRHEPH